MLTACPRCGAHLAVTAAALRAARGLCRCGACRALFPAWAHLMDPPAAAFAAEVPDSTEDFAREPDHPRLETTVATPTPATEVTAHSGPGVEEPKPAAAGPAAFEPAALEDSDAPPPLVTVAAESGVAELPPSAAPPTAPSPTDTLQQSSEPRRPAPGSPVAPAAAIPWRLGEDDAPAASGPTAVTLRAESSGVEPGVVAHSASASGAEVMSAQMPEPAVTPGLLSLPPASRPGTATSATPEDAPPSLPLRAVLEENESEDEALDRELRAPLSDGGRPAEVLLAAGARGLREPDWVRAPHPRRGGGLGLLWRLALVVLLLALIIQLAIMQAGPLAAIWPPVRPYIAQLWQQMGHEPPWQREVDRLRVLRSDVRENPERPGTLLVTVTLLNEALFEQPFPLIELTLGDATQALVGRRRFEPAIYLGREWQQPAFMPLGVPVDVVLELASSHDQAAAFTIKLL